MHPKQKALIIIFVFLFSLIQATFLNYITIYGVKPDILLTLVIFSCLYANWQFALKVGLFSGLLKDLLSAGIFGLNILIFGLIGLILGLYSKKIYRESTISQLLICFMVSLITSCLYYIATRIFLPLPEFVESLKMIIFPAAIYTSLVFWLVSSFLFKALYVVQQEI